MGFASLRFKGTGAYAYLNLEGESVTVPAGARGTWTVAYRADAWPVQPGGSVTLWKWGPKFAFGVALQDRDPTLPDYCSAHVVCTGEAENPSGRPPSPAASVELTDLTPQYKRYRQATLVIGEHALASGDSVCFVAGDTTGGAPPIAVLAFTASDVAIDVQVDHDGDGHPETQHRLWIHVVPDAATRIRAVAPSVVVVGEPFGLEVRAEDMHCNPGAAFEGNALVMLDGAVLANAAFPPLADPARGRLRIEGLRLEQAGVHRLEVTATAAHSGGAFRTRANPTRVVASPQHGQPPPLRAYWGEMHNHTTWCEGMATVEENYRFAREDACLDFYAASEHIMLGPGDDFPITDEDSPPASSAAYWRECRQAAHRHHSPGRFVTYMGYEWTALLGYDTEGRRRTERHTWGDHCAWFLHDDHPLVIEASLDGELAALASLAHAALSRGAPPPAMIIPHPGGGATDWTHYGGRDLVAMPTVETSSQHAHTEWFYQRALATGRREGFRLGVCAMDDGHMGHPGYDVWSRHGVSTVRERAYSVEGGLTAALAPELTREAVWDAFFDRRTFATSGERMLLDVWVDNADTAGPADPRHTRAQLPAAGAPGPNHPGRLSAGQVGAAATLPCFRVQASGTASLDLVEIIRDDRLVQRWVLPPNTWDVDLTWTDPHPLHEEAAYYVRVTQTGDAFAWSSPIWFTYTSRVSPARPLSSGDLPAWNEGIWPLEGDLADQAEAASFLPALEAFLVRQGAAGRYVDLRPVGMFHEHRGRYALFRGHDSGAPADRNQIHALYYPDFPEERIRVGQGWADYGPIGRAARTAPADRPAHRRPHSPTATAKTST